MLLVSGMLLGISWVAMRRKTEPAAFEFGLLMLAGFFWAFFYGLEMVTVRERWLWPTLIGGYAGIATVSVFWMRFCAAYTGRASWFSPVRLRGLFVVPMMTLFAVASSPWHRWYYAHLEVASLQGVTYFLLKPGPFYWLHVLYSWALVAVGLLLLSRHLFSVSRADRLRVGCFMLAALLPFLANIAYVAGFRPFGFLDITPIAFLVMGIVLLGGILRLHLFDVFPLALDTLFRQLPDPVWLQSPAQTVLNANPSAELLLKQFPQTMDLIPLAKEGREIALGGRCFQLQRREIISLVGKTRGELIVLRDITELSLALEHARLTAARAEEASQAKGRFLANISHEVRTPMNGILGMTALLLDTPLTPEQQHYAEVIQQSGAALMEMMSRVLEITRLGAREVKIDSAPFCLRALLDTVIQPHWQEAAVKGIPCVLEISEALPEWIEGDEARIRQIMNHLLQNAVKFTQRGQIRLRATCVAETGRVEKVCFEVSDTGVGIAPEALERIFEPFTQADGSSSRSYGGMGLGLSICKELAGLMDGKICVLSTPGIGSRFLLTLPLQGLKQGQPAAPAQALGA